MIGKLHVLQNWAWDTAVGEGHDLIELEETIKAYGFDEVFEVSGKQLALRNRCRFTEALEEAGKLDDYRAFVSNEGENTDELDTTRFTGKPWPFEESLHPDVFTGDRLVDFIKRQDPGTPFFLHASFCSPHPPFDPPARFIEGDQQSWTPLTGLPTCEESNRKLQAMAKAYRGLVRLVDEQVGRIWDALESTGLAENTVILFTSDHGEMLGDHAAMQKSSYYESSVRIPLLVSHPQIKSGSSIDSLVESTDLTATILDCAGIDPQSALGPKWPAYNDQVPCRSLLPLMRGETESIRETAYSECFHWQMLTDGRHKYVRIRHPESPGCPRELLFDTSDGSNETMDHSKDEAYSAVLDSLRRQWLAREERLIPAQLGWAPHGPSARS